MNLDAVQQWRLGACLTVLIVGGGFLATCATQDAEGGDRRPAPWIVIREDHCPLHTGARVRVRSLPVRHSPRSHNGEHPPLRDVRLGQEPAPVSRQNRAHRRCPRCDEPSCLEHLLETQAYPRHVAETYARLFPRGEPRDKRPPEARARKGPN